MSKAATSASDLPGRLAGAPQTRTRSMFPRSAGWAALCFAAGGPPSRQPSRQPRADECPVCFGTTRECALVPCGHLLCDTCAVVYDDGGRPCPVCRTPVERVMKVYF
mgnify:CR=1 FL=1